MPGPNSLYTLTLVAIHNHMRDVDAKASIEAGMQKLPAECRVDCEVVTRINEYAWTDNDYEMTTFKSNAAKPLMTPEHVSNFVTVAAVDALVMARCTGPNRERKSNTAKGSRILNRLAGLAVAVNRVDLLEEVVAYSTKKRSVRPSRPNWIVHVDVAARMAAIDLLPVLREVESGAVGWIASTAAGADKVEVMRLCMTWGYTFTGNDALSATANGCSSAVALLTGLGVRPQAIAV